MFVWINRFLLAVGVALLCSFALVAPAAEAAQPATSTSIPTPTSPTPTTEFTVLTYNIQQGADSSGVLDLAETARVLQESRADIVCLQEVDVNWSSRSEFLDEAKVLADALRFEYRFAPIYSLNPPRAGAPRREFGLAVLSRYPILSFTDHDLSRISSLEQAKGVQILPGFPEVVVEIAGRRVRIFNTHLSWLDAGLRLQEAQEMLDIISRGEGPVVLTGDMNALPDDPEIILLTQTLADAFASAGDEEGFTYPGGWPTKRIDYIFTSKEIVAVQAKVIETFASDHRPVLARLTINP